MKLPVPPPEAALVHETRIPMRWGDMDALGHVNNTLYLRYFEEARVRWLTESGRAMTDGVTGPVVVNVFCNFHQQLEYPATLVVRQFVGQVGRSSCDLWMRMEVEGQPGKLVADGGATMVWVDFARQKSVELPQWLRAGLVAAQAQAEPDQPRE